MLNTLKKYRHRFNFPLIYTNWYGAHVDRIKLPNKAQKIEFLINGPRIFFYENRSKIGIILFTSMNRHFAKIFNFL